MDSGDLIYFAAVAKTGSLTKAAMFLGTVQSNVTLRIKRLEDELGLSLFHRHGRGVTLTAAGSQLLPYARQIDTLLDEAKRATVDEGEPSGSLHFGSMESTAALRLPDVLVDYASEYPMVDISLRTGTSQSLMEDVLERRIEGALISDGKDHIDLIKEKVIQEELVIVAAPWVQRLRGARAAWAASANEIKIVVFRNGCSYREILERFLMRQGITSIKRMELGTLEGIIGCVRAGIAITMLPRAVVASLSREGKVSIHELPDGQGAVDTVFIRRRDAFTSPALHRFVDKLHQHFPVTAVEPQTLTADETKSRIE